MTDHADHFLGKDPQHPRPTWEELKKRSSVSSLKNLGAVQVEIGKKALSNAIQMYRSPVYDTICLHEQTVRCCESKEKLWKSEANTDPFSMA